MSDYKPYRGPWYRGPAFLMMLALLAFYVSSSFASSPGFATQIWNLLTIIVVLLGLRAFTQKPGVFATGLAIVVGFATLSALLQVFVTDFDYRWISIGVLFFFGFVLLAMARIVFEPEYVTADKIFAAACVYLLAGICFGLLFVVIEQTYPGSFTLSESDSANLYGSLVHFSFTTLTTVGYGNISPISNSARSLADMEAVLAQLFLAIVVARLVSLQITRGGELDE